MPNEKKSWDISKYIKVTVLPDKEFQQNLKAQQRLQQATETLALPTDPNVDLVKKIHEQLPITNWAWKLTKQREYEKQRITQHSFNYSPHPKLTDDGPTL
ncbi:MULTISPECIES: hypothetical protein [Lactobacillaceae]|uniref:Uncharacterized protein n=1 Tax=Limosilactobacillus reuteri TaxID=1598 RepID=A0AB36AFM2_LIMRT|nr:MULTISPECIES: hypothetical protein [Lactobacillaceae]MCC4330837.1 hypothetical protein [Limosilactobacillus reuteri]MCC4353087.1 hypothetical protein [Limosilactobacillus reuteri]MCC4358767.1 hypothetical protein [Limosilactobacillus reuteri]MCC4363415.1 hypothetical protein [Limosilactobacillus reuteri]MCC4365211.1 hypothetical protein [Limosilactobacillus reuteri]